MKVSGSGFRVEISRMNDGRYDLDLSLSFDSEKDAKEARAMIVDFITTHDVKWRA